MTVSKRTRFEVLRRDNYTCRYCRSTDGQLHVDHVTPVSLGGTDDPSNLVAACKDCNAGKSSSAPDTTTVADVREDAMRHAELVKAAYGLLLERLGERDDYIAEFDAAYTYGLPQSWRVSVGRWFEMGVPIELVVDAAEISCSMERTFPGTDRFRYMCGIVWNQVETVTAEASARQYLDGKWLTDSDLTDERIDSYEKGQEWAWARAGEIYGADYLARKAVEIVVDGPTALHPGSKISPRDPLAELREAVGVTHGS